MTAANDLPYGFMAEVPRSYEQAVSATRDALAAKGFGVLTEIDVKATLKKKLDVNFRPYLILGACNPPMAHRALSAEIDIGYCPCNVIVQSRASSTTDGEIVDGVLGAVPLSFFMQMLDKHVTGAGASS